MVTSEIVTTTSPSQMGYQPSSQRTSAMIPTPIPKNSGIIHRQRR